MSCMGAEQLTHEYAYRMTPLPKLRARLASPHRFQSDFNLRTSSAALTVLTLVVRPALQLRKCQHCPQCQVHPIGPTQRRLASRGSSASRSPSPSMFTANTVMHRNAAG